LDIDAVSAAIGQAGLAEDLTLTRGANFTGLAFIIAFSAVFTIRLQIYAQCTADHLPDGTTQFAFAIFADLASFTGIGTGSTVGAVGLSVDAVSGTFGSTFLARESANAFGTDLAVFAEIAAFSAVCAVGLGVDAISGTFGSTFLTRCGAVAIGADLPLFTGVATDSAM
jgi:hypothetical protein